jgi:hypothetical protein
VPLPIQDRPKFLANRVVISTTREGETRLTIHSAIGDELVSTGHGASTPVSMIRNIKNRMHSQFDQAYPVEQDDTKITFDVVFPRGTEVVEEA